MVQRHLELEVTTRLLLRDMNLSNPSVNLFVFLTIFLKYIFILVSACNKPCTGGHRHWVSLLQSFTKWSFRRFKISLILWNEFQKGEMKEVEMNEGFIGFFPHAFAFNLLEVNESCWCIGLCGTKLMGMSFPLHHTGTVPLGVPIHMTGVEGFSVPLFTCKDASKAKPRIQHSFLVVFFHQE